MERQLKTIREWFESWEDYGQLAIMEAEEQEENALNAKVHSLAKAISGGFRWRETSQGHEYWEELRDSISTPEDVKEREERMEFYEKSMDSIFSEALGMMLLERLKREIKDNLPNN